MKRSVFYLALTWGMVYAVNLSAQTTIVQRYYGIYTDNPMIVNKMPIDDVTGHIYVWENTLVTNMVEPAEGEGALGWKSNNVGWWGFGIHDDRKPSLLDFKNGFLVFSVRTTSPDAFEVNVFGASNSKGKIIFPENGGPQGFLRNSNWHKIEYPVIELVKQGLKLNQVPIPFAAVGGTNISDIAFDDIYYYAIDTIDQNPVDTTTNPPTGIKNSNSQNLFFAPNPSSLGYILMYTDNPIDELALYNVNGKLINLYKNVSPGMPFRISVQNLPKGIYIAQIRSKSQQLATHKIILQ